MRLCPECGRGRVVFRSGFAVNKAGSALAGVQMKASVKTVWIVECSEWCGWALAGDIEGAQYDGEAGEFSGGTFVQDDTLKVLPVTLTRLED